MNFIVDSCVFISFYDSSDSNHEKAINDLEKISSNNDSIWVTEHILDEILNIFLRRNYKKQISSFIDLIKKNNIRIVFPKNQASSLELASRTMEAVLKQKRKKASYTDLYSLEITMSQPENTFEVISYDHPLKY
jgi:predicted nucleic acid-binding protein